MEDQSFVSPAELRALQRELQIRFRQGQWDQVGGVLTALVVHAKSWGDLELGHRAQGLRELLGQRAGGRVQAGPRLESLFHDLLCRLDRLEWSSRSDRLH
jgi:hypothetical protein